MKCIRCQHDSKYRERSNGRCPNCQQRFAFEPRNGDPVTDGVFAAAIERVSASGSVKFNLDHLYYDVLRRYQQRAGTWPGLGVAIPIMIVSCIVLANLFSVLVGLIVVGLLGGGYLWLGRQGKLGWRRLERAKFDALLRRYVQAHGALNSVIERRSHDPRRSDLSIDSAEMLAYSFDRAVICDRPETVDLLLANRFHFENNCAVLAVDGYPPQAFEIVRTMLRNNPRLVVVALHDASIAGCQLAHRLRHDPGWFKDGVAVVDAGLRPVHARSFKGQMQRNRPARAVPVGAGISADEASWLARNTLALAVVVPEQIIKRLFRAISIVEEHQEDRPSAGGSSDSGGSGGGDISFEFDHDADDSDGGGDSFG